MYGVGGKGGPSCIAPTSSVMISAMVKSTWNDRVDAVLREILEANGQGVSIGVLHSGVQARIGFITREGVDTAMARLKRWNEAHFDKKAKAWKSGRAPAVSSKAEGR